jgi:hypothetical protein
MVVRAVNPRHRLVTINEIGLRPASTATSIGAAFGLDRTGRKEDLKIPLQGDDLPAEIGDGAQCEYWIDLQHHAGSGGVVLGIYPKDAEDKFYRRDVPLSVRDFVAVMNKDPDAQNRWDQHKPRTPYPTKR